MTFYHTAEGRQVLADLSRIIHTGKFTAEAAVELNDLLMIIKQNAGLTDELTLIEGEAKIVANYTPPAIDTTVIEGFKDEHE